MNKFQPSFPRAVIVIILDSDWPKASPIQMSVNIREETSLFQKLPAGLIGRINKHPKSLNDLDLRKNLKLQNLNDLRLEMFSDGIHQHTL